MTESKTPHDLFQRNDLTDGEIREVIDSVERSMRSLRDDLNLAQKRRVEEGFGGSRKTRREVERITHLVTSLRNTTRQREKGADRKYRKSDKDQALEAIFESDLKA